MRHSAKDLPNANKASGSSIFSTMRKWARRPRRAHGDCRSGPRPYPGRRIDLDREVRTWSQASSRAPSPWRRAACSRRSQEARRCCCWFS